MCQAERVRITDLPIVFLPLPATAAPAGVYADVTAAAATAARGGAEAGTARLALAAAARAAVVDYNRLSATVEADPVDFTLVHIHMHMHRRCLHTLILLSVSPPCVLYCLLACPRLRR